MVKHTQAICWLLLTNCSSVLNNFVGLVLKGLRIIQNNVLANEPCMIRPTLVGLNPAEPNHYPFRVTVNKCNGCYLQIYVFQVKQMLLYLK